MDFLQIIEIPSANGYKVKEIIDENIKLNSNTNIQRIIDNILRNDLNGYNEIDEMKFINSYNQGISGIEIEGSIKDIVDEVARVLESGNISVNSLYDVIIDKISIENNFDYLLEFLSNSKKISEKNRDLIINFIENGSIGNIFIGSECINIGINDSKDYSISRVINSIDKNNQKRCSVIIEEEKIKI